MEGTDELNEIADLINNQRKRSQEEINDFILRKLWEIRRRELTREK